MATELSGTLAASRGFELYLSSDDAVKGTLVLSSANGGVTSTLAPISIGPGDVFLHLVAVEVGPTSGFLGQFQLSDAGYSFSQVHGGQTLFTNTTDWTVRTGSFAGNDLGVALRGANGDAPWGLRAGVASGASWIWSAESCNTCSRGRYFSAKVTSMVPEPQSYLLMALGVLAVAASVRRRRG